MVKIRKFRKRDITEVAKLVHSTYKRFCAKDATHEANQRYLDQYDVKKKGIRELEREFLRTKVAFVAIADNKIVGVIRGGMERIGNLFVDSDYQRKGIANELVGKFEKEVKRLGVAVIKITASLYAVPFYLAVGYKKTTGIRNHKGIKVQPMKKVLPRRRCGEHCKF